MGRNARTPFPWTAGFARLFAEKGGELAELTALFEGGTNDSTRLYERLILEREGEVYYRRLSEWCAAHGIALVGHPHRSDDIELERWFEVPGQDLALLLGRRRNASECLGACNRGGNPWQLSGADVKWYLDWLAVRGVNLFIPHAFYYSIEGPRCQERPPDVGPHSIWWGRYEKWARYMARLCFLWEPIFLVWIRKSAVLQRACLLPGRIRPARAGRRAAACASGPGGRQRS